MIEESAGKMRETDDPQVNTDGMVLQLKWTPGARKSLKKWGLRIKWSFRI